MVARKPKYRKEYFVKIPHHAPVKVNREIYCYWYASRRKEKTLREKDNRHESVSWEALTEKMGERVCAAQLERDRSEDSKWVLPEEVAEQNFAYGRLYQELQRLTPEEQNLMFSLFYECVSLRELAKDKGVSRNTITQQRDKVLAKLAKMLADIK